MDDVDTYEDTGGKAVRSSWLLDALNGAIVFHRKCEDYTVCSLPWLKVSTLAGVSLGCIVVTGPSSASQRGQQHYKTRSFFAPSENTAPFHNKMLNCTFHSIGPRSSRIDHRSFISCCSDMLERNPTIKTKRNNSPE